MKEFWDNISTWPVLKWVVLVLVAGFIGQFGKMMADAIMERVRRRRAGRPTADTPGFFKTPPSDSAGSASSDPPGISEVSAGIPDKKYSKALAKARKKEAKKK
jgi:hypothetical protein